MNLAILLLLMSCNKQLVPPPVVIEAGGAEFCPAACAQLTTLGCSEGLPLEDGTTCEVFCVETVENGHPLNPECISKLTACDDIDACTGG